MLTNITLAKQSYRIAVDSGVSLAISVCFNDSKQQPNHFGATPALASPMQAGSFVGDTEQGGSCNVNELTLNPHCNGTHTETIAHICDASDHLATKIAALKLPAIMPCALISITPILASKSRDSYSPPFNIQDRVIDHQQLATQLTRYTNEQLQTVAIRTLPNSITKCQAAYHDKNQPAFLTREAVLYLNERGVEHLILDVPSLDRLDDNGLLTCHHLFWHVAEGTHQASANSLCNKTITELAYIDNDIADGFYFVNLQTPAFINDAAPSRPVLYLATPIIDSE